MVAAKGLEHWGQSDTSLRGGTDADLLLRSPHSVCGRGVWLGTWLGEAALLQRGPG